MAKYLRKVTVQRGRHDITVVMQCDGLLTYRVFPVDPHRLSLDLQGLTSGIRFQVLEVDHVILKRIRIGQHPKKLRLAFDLNQSLGQQVHYAVKTRGTQLALRLALVEGR